MTQTPDYPPTKTVGIFLFPGFEPIDVFGFAEAFTIARFLGQTYSDLDNVPFKVVFIGREKAKPVKSYNGPSAWTDWDCDQALDEGVDILMIPGGGGTGPLLEDKAFIKWVRAMDKKVPLMASVCTGAAVLAKAGLLNGLPAATNHKSFGWVAGYGPLVLWDSVARWVDAGKYVTSAGVSAGTDMGFYLVERLRGRAVAELAVSSAEYDWHRDPLTPIYYPAQAQYVQEK